jgi:hypothetical protein
LKIITKTSKTKFRKFRFPSQVLQRLCCSGSSLVNGRAWDSVNGKVTNWLLFRFSRTFHPRPRARGRWSDGFQDHHDELVSPTPGGAREPGRSVNTLFTYLPPAHAREGTRAGQGRCGIIEWVDTQPEPENIEEPEQIQEVAAECDSVEPSCL